MLNSLYPMNEKIINEVNQKVMNYHIDKGTFKEESLLNFELLIHLQMLEGFIENIKKKIITPVYYYKILLKEDVKNYSSLAFHAEHSLIRLTSFWEHLFQVLNTYLDIFMSPKKKIIEVNNTWINIFILSIRRNDKEKYLRISQNFLDGQNFVKRVKKKFKNDKILRNIVNISNENHWKCIRNIRNEIVHYKFLGQTAYPLDVESNNYMINIDNSSESKVNHNELITLIDKALEDIKEVLKDTYVLLKHDIVPSEKSSAREEYFLSKLSCSCGEKKICIPDEVRDLDKKLKNNPFRAIFCPNCFSDSVIIDKDKIKVSQKTWEVTLAEYIKIVPQYLNYKLEKLK